MESPYRNRPGVPKNASYIQVIPSEIVGTARQAVPQVPGIPYVSEGQIIPSWVQPGQCQAAPVPVPMPIQSWPQPLSTQPQPDCYKGLIPIRNQMIFFLEGVYVNSTCIQQRTMRGSFDHNWPFIHSLQELETLNTANIWFRLMLYEYIWGNVFRDLFYLKDTFTNSINILTNIPSTK